MPKRNSKGELVFKDFPEFRPNLTPKQIFSLGSFGGTYFRPIYSKITKKKYKNVHKKYSFLKTIPDNKLTREWRNYDKNINKYKVKVGTTLQFWEKKGFITKYHPYGWVHWYCDFYSNKRCPDDKRQIKRWQNFCDNDKGRFKIWLVKLILKKKGKYNDHSISPKIRQSIQNWGCKLTLRDFNYIKKKLQNKKK